jgi:hypothetical protein
LFLIIMLYSDAHAEGRFKPEHMHLRHVKAHLAPVQACLRDWAEERGMESLRAIHFNGVFYRNLPAHADELKIMHDELGEVALPE